MVTSDFIRGILTLHPLSPPFFLGRVLQNLGWPPSCLVVEDDFELLVLLPPFPECQVCSPISSYPVYVDENGTPRAPCMPGKLGELDPQPHKFLSF